MLQVFKIKNNMISLIGKEELILKDNMLDEKFRFLFIFNWKRIRDYFV